MGTGTKFLYGKIKNLCKFIKNGEDLWFRDIYSLNMLENKIICDEESIKEFKVDSKHLSKITLDGRDFKVAPNSIFTMRQPTRRCHVLCLSKDGNKAELFTRFNADICLELNVELMIQLIEQNNENLHLEVIGKDVIYYKAGNMPETLDQKEIVFRKDSKKYEVENEYRIAIYWPYDCNTKVQIIGGTYVNVFAENSNCNDHISFNFCDMDLKQLIIEVRDKNGEVVNL